MAKKAAVVAAADSFVGKNVIALQDAPGVMSRAGELITMDDHGVVFVYESRGSKITKRLPWNRIRSAYRTKEEPATIVVSWRTSEQEALGGPCVEQSAAYVKVEYESRGKNYEEYIPFDGTEIYVKEATEKTEASAPEASA